MSNKTWKHLLAAVMAVCVIVSALPVSALAAAWITPFSTRTEPEDLLVEYFHSTFIHYDQAKANAANAAADYREGTTSAGAGYEGNGFYFTTDKGGKPAERYIPLFSRTWGQNKTNGPAIAGGQADGGNDPNNSGQDQDFYIYSGIAADRLSESTNIPFDNAVNAAPGFFSTDPNIGTEYRTVYSNVGVPYIYEEATGYYTLNSDANGVYFEDGVAASNTNLKVADLPTAIQMNGDGALVTGLAPFVDVTDQIVDAAPSGRDSVGGTNKDKVKAYRSAFSTNNAEADRQLFAFGMVTEINFQMTDDGKSPVSAEEINFHFSGDDDVWVYIDGVLVLDIGGVHDAIQGNINFTTGNVTVSAPNSRIGKVGDRAVNPTMDNTYAVESLSQGNIYEKLDTTLTGFAAGGQHTMTIYYMERGEGKSNCYIRFNLPQRDIVEVTKKFDSSKDENGQIDPLDSKEAASFGGHEFGFTLYNNGKKVANKTYYVYDENGLILRSPSTNAAGHFLLRRNETARFLVNIGQNDTYQVVEDTMTVDGDGFRAPLWSYSTNISGAAATAETVNDFAGMVVTVTGSDTASDSVKFVCENYLSASIPNPGVRTQTDRIVIDYGLPITIPVKEILKNDVIRGEKITLSLPGTGGVYGTAVFSDRNTPDDISDDTITYTLNRQLTGIETLTYAVTVTGTGTSAGTATAEGRILIMPATSVYYEENFGAPATIPETGDIDYGLVTYSNGTLKWKPAGDSAGGNQETGMVGTIGDSTYGSDAAYLSNLGDSNGTSMVVTMNDTNSARFEYDFTGTGTAIYGRISDNTGYIQVKITADNGAVSDMQYVDTRMLAAVGGADALYNIPIYRNNALRHGNYHVKVTVYAQGTPTGIEGGAGGAFYLDGIRIYTPVNQPAYDAQTGEPVDPCSDTVYTAYADDGEANTVVVNIRDKIIADMEDGILSDVFFTLTDVNGEIVTGDDGSIVKPGGDTQSVDGYLAYGPNNEFYLNNTGTDNKVYTVSFKLINWDSTRYTLYLGMKVPAGNAAAVRVGGQQIMIHNSTDCYYDISKYISVVNEDADGDGTADTAVGTVTITGVSGLVGLTDIKVTGTGKFALGNAEQFVGTGERQDAIAPAEMLYMVPAAFSFTPAVEEAAVFNPVRLDISGGYSRSLRTAVLNIKTSVDVRTLTVNGEEVKPIRRGNTNFYIYTATRVPSGTIFEIVAYDAKGNASEPAAVIAQERGKTHENWVYKTLH